MSDLNALVERAARVARHLADWLWGYDADMLYGPPNYKIRHKIGWFFHGVEDWLRALDRKDQP